MKLKTNELKNLLSMVTKAASTSNISSIHSCILLSAKDGVCTGTCNNSELIISDEIAEESKVEEAFVVEAKLITSIVSKFNGEDTTLTINDKNLIVKSKTARFTLSLAYSVEEFTIENMEEKVEITVDSGLFVKNLKKTIYAVATETTGSNNVMSGMNLKLDKGVLSMTALDGHRVSINKMALETKDVAFNCIVPGTSIKNILSSINGTGDISIKVGAKSITFVKDQLSINTRLIEGTYIDVSRMVGGKKEIRLEIKKSELMDAINRAKIVSSMNEFRNTPVVLKLSATSLNVSAKNSITDMEEDVSAVCNVGAFDTIAFNPNFISDMLNVIEEEDIAIEMTGNKAPVFIEGETYTMFVLPVNIR